MSEHITLIVRCFNEEAHIGRLLTGVAHQTRPADEVIVVDSGSTDASASIAEAFGARIVTISPERFSFGRALNIGIDAAPTADLLVLASAHVYPVYDTWLERLVTPFSNADVALTYGRQQTPDRGRFSEQRLLAQWFPTRSAIPQRTPFCNNANAAIRRSAWEELPYNEELTGLEDLDWAKRALEDGKLLAYVAEAPVVHVHNESFRQVLNRYRREAIAHKQIYDGQHMSAAAAARLALINIFGDYRSAIDAKVVRRHLFDIPRFRLAQFIGTYHGFAQSEPVTQVLRRRFYYPPFERSTDHHAREDAIGREIDYDGAVSNVKSVS